jgi:hypothetical protein
MTQPVEEVLCAFIRQRAPWLPAPGQPQAQTPLGELGRLRERLPDVASALVVLSRREGGDDAFRDALWPLDLSEVDLRGADLALPPLADPSGLALKVPSAARTFVGHLSRDPTSVAHDLMGRISTAPTCGALICAARPSQTRISKGRYWPVRG